MQSFPFTPRCDTVREARAIVTSTRRAVARCASQLDTMLLPSHLVRFLSRVPARRPIYFGSIEATEVLGRTPVWCGPPTWARCHPRDFGQGPGAGLIAMRSMTRSNRTTAWRPWLVQSRLAQQLESHLQLPTQAWMHGAPVPCQRMDRRSLLCSRHRHEAVQYVQGGIEGLTISALERVVASECVQHVGHAPCFESWQCVHRAEDATLGICMRELGVPLWQCPCFHPTGPCEVSRPTTCHGRLCPRPISIHKLKRVSWYDAWWKLLTDNETAAQMSPPAAPDADPELAAMLPAAIEADVAKLNAVNWENESLHRNILDGLTIRRLDS
jgi:hypothetical protein